jgi:hypothetical protein
MSRVDAPKFNYQPLEQARINKEARVAQLMDRMETSVDKYGQYFIKLGQKDSSSDNRAMILTAPFLLPDPFKQAYLVICHDGFRVISDDKEAILATLTKLKNNQDNVGAEVSYDSLGGYSTTQDGVGSLRMPSYGDENIEFKSLQELPVGIDIIELFTRSIEEEKTRLQEFINPEEQETEMARSVMVTFFPNPTA